MSAPHVRARAAAGSQDGNLARAPAAAVVLVIAGVDCSGGAGLVRDVLTLQAFGVQQRCAVSAVTAQTAGAVSAVHAVPPEVLRAQLRAGLEDGRVRAVKIGMLGTRANVDAVVECLPARESVPIVLDPVLAASSGGALIDQDGLEALRTRLLPRVTLLTPNLPEAAQLLGAGLAGSVDAVSDAPSPLLPPSAGDAAVPACPPDAEAGESMQIAEALRLLALGPAAVLLKGGHAGGPRSVDLLVAAGEAPRRLTAPRVAARCRGTGCALSSAIAAGLAVGLAVGEACEGAKDYVTALLLEAGRQRPESSLRP